MPTGDAWADSDCGYRMKLTFGNSASLENLADFPVLVVLNPSRIDYSKTSAADIRFYDGATLLPKETELWNPSGSSYIWVKVPQIDNTNADYIYAYYNSSTGSTNVDDAANVWSGYAMVQHLDETTGNLTDSTSNQNDGVPYGVTLNSLGKIDGGDYYNGNAYSVIKDNSTLNFGTNSFSYSFWFNTTKTATTQDILDKKGGTATATSTGYKMVISSSGTTGFSAAIGDGTNYKRLDSGTDSAWNGNVWTMFTVVVNRTSQLMLMYINGVHKTNITVSTVGSVNNALNLRLGNDTTSLARGYFGGLDEIRISSVARSASWTYADYLSNSDQFITYGSEETPSGTVYLTLTVTSPQNITYYGTTVTLAGSTNLNANITYKLDSQADVSISNNTQTFSTSLTDLIYASHSVTVNTVETGNPTNTNSSTVYFTTQTVPWADPACHYRLRLTFNNFASSENLTNFPVLVVLNSGRIDYSKTSATDIRFYDGETLLKKDTEVWNASGNSYIWVKVPQIDNTNTDYIYAYYNCSGSSNFDDAASVWNDYAMVQHLEETSGTVLTDSTSNHNDGQPVGVTLDTPGKIDGADDYVGSIECYSNVTDSSTLNFGTNSFSYSFWFKSRWNGTQDVIDKKSGNADAVLAGYKMTISSVEATGYSVALGDGVSNVRLNTGPEPTRGANVWTMFTVVVNRTEQLMYAYVNGVLRKSVSINSIGSVSNNLNLTLGRGYDSGTWGRNFTGSLDEVCIMNGARSTSWVKAQYLSMNDSFIIFHTEEFHNDAPNEPSSPSPSNGASGIPTSTTVSVIVTDPQGDPMNVSFYQQAPSSPDNFTIVVLPDTQNYVLSYPAIFDNQTGWIVNNAANLNIVFVTHEGDLIDTYGTLSQWNSANHSMSILDGSIPWAIAPGNHDLNRTEPTNTTNFNVYFNATRFTGNSWYGGSYNNDNANSFQLFTCGSDEYLIFHLQYNAPDAVLTWANQTIDSYSDSRVIVTTHEYLTSGSRTSVGENLWQKFIRPHTDQIFLVLSGHSSRESRRTDTVNGYNVYQVEADYQGDSNGGNGWLRLLQFKPLEDKIYVKTYSPYLNTYETDSDSQFALDYDMSGTTSTPTLIGTALNVASGNVASVPWNELNYSTTYQWYAVANDTYGATNQSDGWSFTTMAQATYTLTVFTVGSGSVNLNNTGPYYYGDVVQLSAVPSAGWSFDHWTGDSSGSLNPTTILIDDNKAATATFTQNVYTLTTSAVGDGSVSRNNSGPYHFGDFVDLTAIPAAGWSFNHWSGDVTGSTNPETILINGNKDVTAIFTQNEYTLDTSVVGSGTVNLNNTGLYHYGDTVELTAIPTFGWSFDHWSGDLIGSTNPDIVTITDNKAVTVTFTHNTYTLTISTDGNGTVTRDITDPYYYGDIVELTAVPDNGWVFDHWSGDLAGSSNPDTTVMTEDKTVTAHFTLMIIGDHDIAITNVTTSKDGCRPMLTVPDNSFVKINVTVLNRGNFTETYNVTVYANETVIETQIASMHLEGTTIVLQLTWNTTGWTRGNYTIRAYATPVPSEVNTADNTFIAGIIKIAIPGDINGDGIVDIFDAILLSGSYNSVPGRPNWSPNADIKADDVVDIYDAIVLSNHYNQHE